MDFSNKVHPWQIPPKIKNIFQSSNLEDIEVSLVIPFFNQENTLEKCIEYSIKNVISNFELILVNDASEDNSDEIAINTVLRHQKKNNFKRAKIITNKYPIFETACDNQDSKSQKVNISLKYNLIFLYMNTDMTKL